MLASANKSHNIIANLNQAMQYVTGFSLLSQINVVKDEWGTLSFTLKVGFL